MLHGGLILAHQDFVLVCVLGPVGVSGREVSGPLFRVQALNALIDFTVFLVYRTNLLIDLGFVGGSFGQLSSPPRTFHLRPNSP